MKDDPGERREREGEREKRNQASVARTAMTMSPGCKSLNGGGSVCGKMCIQRIQSEIEARNRDTNVEEGYE